MFDPGSSQLVQNGAERPMGDQAHTSEKPLTEFPFCYSSSMHKPNVHPPGLPPPCPTKSFRLDVNQPFGYNYQLMNHVSMGGASSENFKCEICGLIFTQLSLLNHHKRIHVNPCSETEFTCDVCGTMFNHITGLKEHKLNAHPAVSTKSCNVNMDVDNIGLNKKSKYTETDQYLEGISHKHVNYSLTRDVCVGTDEFVSTSEESKKTTGKRRTLATITKCPKCNGSGIIIVGQVQEVIEKPYHCNICDSTFSRYSSLWSHRRLHSGEKPFKCELCGSTFARASSLKNHTRVHTGERPYKCTVCGMQFSQAHHLKSHERIHSGEKPYECEICGKTFARHSTLWNHRRIHTGEKPYRCDICGSAFHQATHLKNHAKVHTGEKPHRCDICDVGFSDKFALKRHRGIHEKYGQTGSNQTNRSLMMAEHLHEPWKPMQVGVQVEDSEVYKCEDDSGKEVHDSQSCGLTADLAYPACSRAPDKQ